MNRPPRRTRASRRRPPPPASTGGFALPAAIGALVIIAILVTAGFFMARQELRIGVASANSFMAVNMAQSGANEVMARSQSLELTHMALWDTISISGSVTDGSWDVRVSKFSPYIFQLTSTGEVTRGGVLWSGASRTVGISARVLTPYIYPAAALTTRGQVRTRGSAVIQGGDSIPTSWQGTGVCAELPTEDRIGVLTDDTTAVINEGSSSVEGSPPLGQDTTIADSTFTDFDAEHAWADLVALAKNVNSLGSPITNTRPDSTGPGACNEATVWNWGDSIPGAACARYFPILYYNGDVTIQSSAYGQGILLIDGDLLMQGGYTFFGLIITQGSFSTAGSGARIFGSVLAGNGTENDVAGSSIIQSSHCATTRALLHSRAARLRPLARRGWIDLTAVTN